MSETRTRPRGAALLLLLAATGLAACGDDPTGPQPIEDTIFVDRLEIDLADFTVTESGVYVREDVVGEGEEAVEGSMPVVEIQGWLPNGGEFQPLDVFGDEADEAFILGGGGVINVIPGFDLGIQGEGDVPGMRVGGTRTIIVPAELGYGDNVLVFEITLLELRDVEEEDPGAG